MKNDGLVRRLRNALLHVPGVAATYRLIKPLPETRLTRHFEEGRYLMQRYDIADFNMTREGAFFRSPWGAEFLYVPHWGSYGAEHQQIHELGELKLSERVVPKGTSVIDIGANLGTFCIHLAMRRPDLKVIAFEPVRSTFEHLAMNLRRNRLTERVQAFPIAVADASGELIMTNRGHTDNYIIRGRVREHGTEMVRVVTLDDFVEREQPSRIGLLKVDIEGAELLALRGAARTLASHRPALLLEVEEAHLARFNASIADLERFLEQHGYARSESELLLPHNRFYTHGESDPLAEDRIGASPRHALNPATG
jgi:FkbM family methyltransferase